MGFGGLTTIGYPSHPSLSPATLLPPPLLSSPALPLPQCLPTVQSSVQQPVKRKAPPPASLPSKRGSFDLAQLPSDLGELIARDTALLQRLGWHLLWPTAAPPATLCPWITFIIQLNASCACMRIEVPWSSSQRHRGIANTSSVPYQGARIVPLWNTLSSSKRSLLI